MKPMLVVSLHNIRLNAPVGLYAGEAILLNNFEIDVDVHVAGSPPWPFVDYTVVRERTATVFAHNLQLLEDVVVQLHGLLLAEFPFAARIRVAVRKLHPPMPGEVGYAQVVYDA